MDIESLTVLSNGLIALLEVLPVSRDHDLVFTAANRIGDHD